MKTLTQVVLLVAAVVISGAIVYGANMVADLLTRQNDEIALLRLTVAQLEQKLDAIPESQQTRRMQEAEKLRSNDSRRHKVSTSGSPQLGPDGAEITLVEFNDFQCPYCRRVQPTISRIRSEYGSKVRVVFKHYPLRIHPEAMGAHIAAEAAHQQGKFWEMHDLIFSDPSSMSDQSYEEYAQQIGLDMEDFKRDIGSDAVRNRVQEDVAEARRLGIRGTPGFLVNGIFISGARPFESFKDIIDQELSTM